VGKKVTVYLRSETPAEYISSIGVRIEFEDGSYVVAWLIWRSAMGRSWVTLNVARAIPVPINGADK
jgi:hypothetical protein